MKTKNLYIAVQIKENEKYYAYVIKTADNNNVLGILDIPGIITANVCNKSDAYRIVEEWNNGFKRNGKYMFDSPAF